MYCPVCLTGDSQVIETTKLKDMTLRYHECKSCKCRFFTKEIDATPEEGRTLFKIRKKTEVEKSERRIKMNDCSETENYLSEKARMVKLHHCYNVGYMCGIKCCECPLSYHNNGTAQPCSVFETVYPLQAISVVQRWSNAHPKKTYLSEFLHHYPNATLNRKGIPNLICPHDLGLRDIEGCKKCDNTCTECWNQSID